MSVSIKSVVPKSIAAKKRIQSGDTLLSINGNNINDVLDYDFYAAETFLTLELLRQNGKPRAVKIKKEEYADIGLLFETFLMDPQRACKNNCVFCFIDQLPCGMRESLYFKDDDDRLSFLFGNYITLTNIPSEEIDRIIKMHISPINISVHTTNPELRIKMMNNRFAGERLSYLYRLAEAGISLNCQLVLCPGLNDGDELRRSLTDLTALRSSIASIACVPVGITKHRDGLPVMRGFTKEEAGEVIDIIESFGTPLLKEQETRLVYPADEFFIMAQREVPGYEYYGEFIQLENGVGMLALQRYEFEEALLATPENDIHRLITIATGVDAAPFIQMLVDLARKKWHNLNCRVIAIENEFFGKTITVAGLLTGQDIKNRLIDIRDDLGEELLLPSCMLRREQDIFLDDMTLEELKEALQVPIRLCSNDGTDLLNALLGENE